MKEIEIPFGANNSELKGWEYTIPEGMEAEIKDGKIVVREKESEDEMIRKRLINLIKELATSKVPILTGGYFVDGQDKKYIAWLEKQKYDRMKPIYDAKESFESALEKAWSDYHNGYENVDKLEDDYVECAHAKGFREGFLYGLEKQKENPKSADSIPSDCVSDAKCENSWHKVGDSLPDNPREVLCKDEAGNYFIGRYYTSEGWEISNYDDEDKPHHLNPPVSKWIDFPSEKQKDFPTTDKEMLEFLATHKQVDVPEKYKTSDWLFEKQKEQKPKMPPKWLYRLEYKDASCGLWYNGKGKWCFESGIGAVDGCKTKTLPMDYDERYKQDGRDWFSSCSQKEDLLHWYSLEDAKKLISKGFVFTRYLATEYHEYDQQTVFIKETSLYREEIDIFELFEQKPAEWSEEDERIRKAILGFLNPDKGGTKYSSNAELVEWSDWLKSRHSSWKPSEEQMKILEKAVAFFKTEWTGTKIKEVLNLESLYEQLKKL